MKRSDQVGDFMKMFVCTANSIALSQKSFSQLRHVQCKQNGEEVMFMNKQLIPKKKYKLVFFQTQK